ncbi:DUF3309 family protein [Aurantimonas sp. Leaf443]|uniref:DUF3309 family protein n=1 Tax=Aurantimonas sp. Leaf443 TaxID=1736378 RepID=UPI0009E72D8E|nr:DUF3309 family protein [Aurantimonas sp. Leaf443]
MDVGYAPIIVVIVFLLVVAVMPVWPWSRGWGSRPVLALALIFMMIAVFAVIGGFGAI